MRNGADITARGLRGGGVGTRRFMRRWEVGLSICPKLGSVRLEILVFENGFRPELSAGDCLIWRCSAGARKIVYAPARKPDGRRVRVAGGAILAEIPFTTALWQA